MNFDENPGAHVQNSFQKFKSLISQDGSQKSEIRNQKEVKNISSSCFVEHYLFM